MQLVSVVGTGQVNVNGEEILSLSRGSYEIKLYRIGKSYCLVFKDGVRFEFVVDTSKTTLIEKVEEYKKIAKIE